MDVNKVVHEKKFPAKGKKTADPLGKTFAGFDFVNPDIQFLDAQAMEGGADVQVGMGMSGGASGGASKSRSGLGSPDTVAEVDGWFAGWDLMKVACAN
mmetsp:Transcript_109842/g.319597  ORF Transcript_109842/g.319597 Transcript_109842/m.319597 type:complete len:98 (-) Transcript_109842:375-668(-)